MDALKPSRRRMVGLASLTCSVAFVVLSFASVPAGAQSAPASSPSACPVLSLANPNPGDTLIPGDMFISGTASVAGSSQGSGVARVDLFLGERDSGGLFIGSGMTGTGASGDPRAFNVKVSIPDSINTGLNFAAYAIATSGQETTVTFPILVGVQPAKNPAATPTPVPTGETFTSTCGGAPGAQSSSAGSAAPAAAAATPAAPAVSVPTTRAGAAPSGPTCPVLSLANPSPADNLIPGDMFILGTVVDPSATSGTGILRVDLFLGERDAGGLFIGSGVPGSGAGGDPHAFTAKVSIPNTINRGLDFAAYAIATSGQQTAVTFPIFVGVPPAKNPVATPTPIPTVETITNSCGTHM